jgi:hypothetical protein
MQEKVNHRPPFRPFHALALAAALVFGLTVWAWSAAPAVAATPTPPPLSSAAVPAGMPPISSWIIVDLPPDATQLQYGAEVWRLVCSACHAYDGQGLTEAWRSTWAPADQNCWQSKCHGPNHPPDGFLLPIAPGVLWPGSAAPFASALELHDFIQRTMPWQDPGGLTDKESWSVTAYVVKLNRLNPGGELGAANAAEIRLRPAAAATTNATATITPSQPGGTGGSNAWPWLATAVVILGLAVWALRRARTGRPTGRVDEDERRR